jgi:NADPH:quinone reductase-like Zn-dependent oxidoreductase
MARSETRLPPHPGAGGAGEVSSFGEGVTNLKIGDRVVINASISCGECSLCLNGKDNLCREWHLLGETIRGTYAEYVVVPAINLLPLPETIKFEEAAAASLVFHTTWYSIIARGRLQKGEPVPVVGASGGVNTASIQVAKHIGAKVYAVGSSREKLSLAESLGVDVLIDRSKEENWSKAIYLATERQGVDVVADNVGAGTMPRSLRAACKGGRILTVGNTGVPNLEIDNRYIFSKHLSVLGSTMGTQNDYATMMELIFEGKLMPVIDRQYPLKEAAVAQERLAAGQQMGKITLAI